MKKNLFCIIASILLSCTTIFAQTSLYRVEAGDTFNSIAKEFGITVETLKEANPNVKTLFAGMKINIPEKKTVIESAPVKVTVAEQKTEQKAVTQTVTEQAPTKVTAAETTTTSHTSTSTNTSSGMRSVGIGRFGGGMLFNEGELVKGAFTFEFYLASRNYMNDLFFIESGLAYSIQSSTSSGNDYKYDATSHSLQIPALAGITAGGYSGLNIYFGPYLDFTVASKTEMEIFGEKTVTRLRDIEDYRRFMLGLKAGAELYIGNFILGTCYSIGLTSHIKGADPSGSTLTIYLAF